MSNPIPTARLDPVTKDLLLNDSAGIDILFSNSGSTSSDIGYKGVVDLFIEKGLILESSLDSSFTYIGTWTNTLDEENVVIDSKWKDSGDSEITTHPYSGSGLTLPSNPNGVGETKEYRWYVIDSPYSSYGPDQPEVTLRSLSVKADEADGADINISTKIKAIPWFRYGTDALDNNATDPAIKGTEVVSTITPRLITVTKTNNKPESEVATGPNYPVKYTLRVDIAENKTIQNMRIRDIVSKYQLLYDPDTQNVSSTLGDPSDSSGSGTFSNGCVDSRLNPTIPGTSHGITEQWVEWDFATHNSGNITGVGGNDITFSYWVYFPYQDIEGNLILNKEQDAQLTVNETATCYYDYNTVPGTSTDGNNLTAKQICIQKTVSSNDNTLIPLSDITYTTNIQVSDFFVLDNLRVTDVLSDGTYLDYPNNVTELRERFGFSFKGTDYTSHIQYSDVTFTDDKGTIMGPSASGSQILNRHTIGYDLNQMIQAINTNTSISTGIHAKGGLAKHSETYADPYPSANDYNFDNNNTGSFEIQITYGAKVDQLYYGRTVSDPTESNTTNKIDIGDQINSSINIYSDNWNWETDTDYYRDTGNNNPRVIDDGSGTVSNIGSVSIQKTIYAIERDGVTITNSETIQSLGLQSQDLVTYRVKVSLSHQNFQDLYIDDYLPPPVMTSANINTTFDTQTPGSSLPSENQIKYGPDHTFTGANVSKDPDSVSINTGSNSFRVTYGNYQLPYYPDTGSHGIGAKVIDILYKVIVTDEPTADQLILTNQAYFNMVSTIGTSNSGQSYTGIRLNQPVLEMKETCAAFDSTNTRATIDSIPVTVSYDTNSYTGSINPSDQEIDAEIHDMNRGGNAKFMIVVKNTGSYDSYDTIIRGDYTNTDQTIDTDSIEILDGAGNVIDINHTLNPKTNFTNPSGLNIGTVPSQDTTNSVRIIMYKAKIKTTVSEIQANESSINTVTLLNWSNKASGQSYPTQTDTATVNLNVPAVSRYITYNSLDPTNVSNRTSDNVTIGEIVRIKSIINIPPGTITGFTVYDEMDHRTNSTSHAGMEYLKTQYSLSGGTFTGSSGNIQNVMTQDYTDSSQYRVYDFGTFVNDSDSEKELIVTQIMKVGNERYDNGSTDYYHLGQNNVSDKYRNNSQTRILLYRNTNQSITSSSNTRLNIKEPEVNVIKEFEPALADINDSTYAKSDTVLYKVTITSTGTGQNGSLTARNLKFSDTVPSDLNIVKAYFDGQSETPFVENPGTNLVEYTFGDFADNTSQILYIECTLPEYHTGDTVSNTASLSYNNQDEDLVISNYYQPPSDDAQLFDDLTLTKTWRSYASSSTLSFRTLAQVSHALINQTDTDDTTFSHPTINGKVTGAVGDQMKSTITVNIPKGKTHIKDIKLKMPSKSGDLILNTDPVTVGFGNDLTYDDSGSASTILSVTPDTVTDIGTDEILFPIEKLFTNTGSETSTLTFDYKYLIKNNGNNVSTPANTYHIDTDCNISTRNSAQAIDMNTHITDNSSNGSVRFYIVEPEIKISQEPIEIPLHAKDDFVFRVTATVGNDPHNTIPFNLFISYVTNDSKIDVGNIVNETVPSDWGYGSVKDSGNNTTEHTFTYNGSTPLVTGNSYVFDIRLPLISSQDNGMSTGDTYTNTVTCGWTSQKSYSLSDDDSKARVRTGNNDTGSGRVNDYLDTANHGFIIEEALEKQRFGLCFEDALDFDYDYEDLVVNVFYRLFRNKRGLKRFVADFHFVARGAAYDHTFGIWFNGLMTRPDGSARNGTWRVSGFKGDNDTRTDEKSNILGFLSRSPGADPSIQNLRDDSLPIVVSTQDALPADGAKDDFSANSANRTESTLNWIKPHSAKVVIDFDSGHELITNGDDFLPYIDVRLGYTASPTYLLTSHRHILGSTVEFSQRTFTYKSQLMSYTNFPKVLVTPVDFSNHEDYGEIPGYYALKDVYTDFVNYVTKGNYPDTSDMVDMTKIKDRVTDVLDAGSWANNSSEIVSNHLMKRTDTEYQAIGLSGVSDKDELNMYHNKHIFRMGNNAKHQGYIEVLKPSGSSLEDLDIDSTSTGFETYASNIKVSANQKITDIVKTKKGSSNKIHILELDTDTDSISIRNHDTLSAGLKSHGIMSKSNTLKMKSSVTNILSIDSNCTLTTTDGSHDILIHNNNSRKVYDACYFNDTDILTIGLDNDIIHTGGSTIDLTGITKAMQIEASETAIVILTPENKTYAVDGSGNQLQLFGSRVIIDIDISSKNVLGLASDGTVYFYDIQTSILTNSGSADPALGIRHGVRKMDAEADWAVFLSESGTVSILGTSGSAPSIPNVSGRDWIAANSSSKSYYDVKAVNDCVILSYI